MTQEHHRAASPGRPVRCAVLTTSDTRTPENDTGGATARRLLESFGHVVSAARIVRDEPSEIGRVLRDWIDGGHTDVIVTTGGTGIAARDTTVPVVRSLLAVELQGFGELFRMLSWEQVGPVAMLSRALGGVALPTGASLATHPGVFLFALPGSVKAVELGVSRLIGPELAHFVWERRRQIQGGG